MVGRKIIGITIGDSLGAGAQIVVKAMEKASLYMDLGFVVIGSLDIVINALNFTGSSLILNTIKEPSEACFKEGVLNLIDINMDSSKDYFNNDDNTSSDEMSLTYGRKAIELCANKSLDAFILGPASNNYNNKLLCSFHRGIEKVFLNDEESDVYSVMIIRGSLRIAYVYFESFSDSVFKNITQNRIHEMIKLTNEILKKMNIDAPRVAVADIFYSGEYKDTNISDEILSAIEASYREGILAYGPISPDSIYLKAASGEYDAIVDMYHERSNIQMEAIGFEFDDKSNRWNSINEIEIALGGSMIGLAVSHESTINRIAKKTGDTKVLEKAIDIASKLVNTETLNRCSVYSR